MKKFPYKWVGFVLLFVLLVVAFYKYLIAGLAIHLVNKVDIHWMGYTNQKVVALTFDDGPDPRFTPDIIRILRRNHIPATFFVVGTNVRKYPELLNKEIELGYQIGNHTLTHPRLSKLNQMKILRQIQATDHLILEKSGLKTAIFRPPYEELTETILLASREAHKKIIMSTVTLERGGKYTPDQEVERVLKLIFPGSIILAHDGRLDRTRTVNALPKLIAGLKAKGYHIVPLKELIRI